MTKEPEQIQWIPLPEEGHEKRIQRRPRDDSFYFGDEWAAIQSIRILAARCLSEEGISAGDCKRLIEALQTVDKARELLGKELRYKSPERLDWLPVVGITDETWEKTTGHRNPLDEDDTDADDSLEDSELGICGCGDISRARDILLNCRSNGGLTREEVDELNALLNEHDKSTAYNEIHKVLSQLGISLK